MINILAILPIFGSVLSEYIWCSAKVIITRIFLLHFSIGFLIGIVVFIHLITLHAFSSSNPLLNSCSSIIIPFFPIIFKDVFSLITSLFLNYSWLLLSPVESLLGNTDNAIASDPLMTPTLIIPEHYYLCYYAVLRSCPNIIVGVILVLIFFLLLLLYYFSYFFIYFYFIGSNNLCEVLATFLISFLSSLFLFYCCYLFYASLYYGWCIIGFIIILFTYYFSCYFSFITFLSKYYGWCYSGINIISFITLYLRFALLWLATRIISKTK